MHPWWHRTRPLANAHALDMRPYIRKAHRDDPVRNALANFCENLDGAQWLLAGGSKGSAKDCVNNAVSDLTAVLSGEVQASFSNIPAISAQMKASKLRALALTGRKALTVQLMYAQEEATATTGYAPVVADQIRRVQAADLVMCVFPFWWFAAPALMKGWFDRL